jgi:hypothetical protein
LRKCMPRSEGGATAQAGTATHGAGEERRGEARRGEERQGKASSGSTTTRTRVDDAGDRRTQAAAWVARLLHSLSAPGGRAPRSKQANANANASASARQMQQIHTRTLPRYLLPILSYPASGPASAPVPASRVGGGVGHGRRLLARLGGSCICYPVYSYREPP